MSKIFVVDSVFNWKPMEFTEDRCDVFSGAGTSEEACS